jgi:hypothetical protein
MLSTTYTHTYFYTVCCVQRIYMFKSIRYAAISDDGAGGPVGDSGEGGEGFENDEDVLADEVMQSYMRPFSETAAAISAAATAAARGSTTPPQIAMYLPAGPGARVGAGARLLNVESLFEVCMLKLLLTSSCSCYCFCYTVWHYQRSVLCICTV